MFESLKGQTYARTVLTSGFKTGRIASTYLFFGPQGVGKKTAALSFAAELAVPPTADEAQTLSVRRRVMQASHPDVQVHGPSGSSFKVEQARAIVKECSLKAFEGGRRVFILDRVELLTEGAGNALLKTLEEPPEGTVFILVTTQKAKVLTTIASRSQSVRFSPLGEADLLELLKQKYTGLQDSQLKEAARLSGGSLVQAQMLLGEDGQRLKELAENFLDAVYLDQALAQMAWVQSASAERAMAPMLMDLIGVYLRDLWCRRQGLDEKLCLLSQAPRNGGGISPLRLESMMRALGDLKKAWGRRPSLNLALALDNLVMSAPDRAAV